MTLTVVLSFVVTMILSAAMIPLIIKLGNQLGIVAHMNKRTVHKHEIARIGGYAIYISSLIGSMLFLKTDHQIICKYDLVICFWFNYSLKKCFAHSWKSLSLSYHGFKAFSTIRY